MSNSTPEAACHPYDKPHVTCKIKNENKVRKQNPVERCKNKYLFQEIYRTNTFGYSGFQISILKCAMTTAHIISKLGLIWSWTSTKTGSNKIKQVLMVKFVDTVLRFLCLCLPVIPIKSMIHVCGITHSSLHLIMNREYEFFSDDKEGVL